MEQEESIRGNAKRLARSPWFWSVISVAAILGGTAAWWGGTTRRTDQFIIQVPLLQPAVPVAPLPAEHALTAGPKRSIRLFLFGDTGMGTEPQFAVARELEKRCLFDKPDGILLLGDNFYMDGVVSVSDPQWQDKFFSPYGTSCLRQVPVYPVLGNHDYKGNIAAQIDEAKIEPQWRLINRFYGINFGDFLYVTALDTNFIDWCGSSRFCVVDFLQQRIKDVAAMASRPWHLVIGHHPFTSSSEKYRGTGKPTQNYLLRNSVCKNADAYISGHSHHLEQRKDTDCGAPFFVSGGGGADLYQVIKDPQALFALSNYGFLELDAGEEFLQWRFIGTDGQVLYETKQARRSFTH